MSNHNLVLNFARELLGYYEVAPQYRPYHGNPGIFLGPPVDNIYVEYASYLEGIGRTRITQAPCRSPTDCHGRFSFDKNSGTGSVESIAASTVAKPLQILFWLNYSFDFRLDFPVLLNPIHSMAFFPYVDVNAEWDVRAAGSECGVNAIAYWNVIDSSTGKPAGIIPNPPAGNYGPGFGSAKYVEQAYAHSTGTNTGKLTKNIPPISPFDQTLYRSRVPLKLGVKYRLIYVVTVQAKSRKGAKCRVKAEVNFSSVA